MNDRDVFKIDLSDWSEPDDLPLAMSEESNIDRVINEEEIIVEPEKKIIKEQRRQEPIIVESEPKRHEPKKVDSGMDLGMLLPLIGGMNPTMEPILKMMMNRGEKFDIMSLLPILMNGGLDGLFSSKTKTKTDKVINLDDYKII